MGFMDILVQLKSFRCKKLQSSLLFEQKIRTWNCFWDCSSIIRCKICSEIFWFFELNSSVIWAVRANLFCKSSSCGLGCGYFLLLCFFSEWQRLLLIVNYISNLASNAQTVLFINCYEDCRSYFKILKYE